MHWLSRILSVSEPAIAAFAAAVLSASILRFSASALAVRTDASAWAVAWSCWIFWSMAFCRPSLGRTLRRLTPLTRMPRGASRAVISLSISELIASRCEL